PALRRCRLGGGRLSRSVRGVGRLRHSGVRRLLLRGGLRGLGTRHVLADPRVVQVLVEVGRRRTHGPALVTRHQLSSRPVLSCSGLLGTSSGVGISSTVTRSAGSPPEFSSAAIAVSLESSLSAFRATAMVLSPLSGFAKVTPCVFRPVRLTSATADRTILPR